MLQYIKQKLRGQRKEIVLDEILDYDESLSFLKNVRGVHPEVNGYYTQYNSHTGNEEEARIYYKNLGLDKAIEFVERYFHGFARPRLNQDLWFYSARHRVLTSKPILEQSEGMGIEHNLGITVGMTDDSILSSGKGRPKIYGEMQIKLYNSFGRGYFLKKKNELLRGIRSEVRPVAVSNQ